MVKALVVQCLKRHASLGSASQERVVQWCWATEAGYIVLVLLSRIASMSIFYVLWKQ